MLHLPVSRISLLFLKTHQFSPVFGVGGGGWRRYRCQTVLKDGHRRTLKQWRAEQLTLSELEFEWIRQVAIGVCVCVV